MHLNPVHFLTLLSVDDDNCRKNLRKIKMCSRTVFRCFRWMERMGDKVTGAAGPVFVTLAVVLLSIGTFAFCESSLFIGDIRSA